MCVKNIKNFFAHYFITLICLFAFWIILSLSVSAKVNTYNNPGLTIREDAKKSSMYKINVIQNKEKLSSFVYEINANHKCTWRHNVLSYTNFSFDKDVTVEITKLSGDPIKKCDIYPKKYGIDVKVISKNTVIFNVKEPKKKMTVIFNDDWITHPLIISADELEKNIPNKTDKNVIFFDKGIHNANKIDVKDGDIVYIAEGAYVKGYIDKKNVKNVTIRGRGILSGESLKDKKTLINIYGESSNNLVEGITFIQFNNAACYLGGSKNNIENIKIVGAWNDLTEGVNVSSDGKIIDSFFKCNDDAIKLYNKDIKDELTNIDINNCVFWQMENGACFQLGDTEDTKEHRSKVRIKDIDIIRKEGDPMIGNPINYKTRAIISSINGSHINEDFLFQDMRFENINAPLIMLNTDGETKDFLFKNLIVNNWNSNYYNKMSGNIHNMLFKNLKINKRNITNVYDARLQVMNGAKDFRFNTCNNQNYNLINNNKNSIHIEAEDYDLHKGTQIEKCKEGGKDVSWINNGDYSVYKNIDFNNQIKSLKLRVSSLKEKGTVEIRIDNVFGPVIGKMIIDSTNGWQKWDDKTTSLKSVSGTHDLYLVYKGKSGYLFNINWLELNK